MLFAKMIRLITIIIFLYEINTCLNQHIFERTPRKRKNDCELPYHSKRRRIQWSTLVRSLGPFEFRRHHRMTQRLFAKIHQQILPHIKTQGKYARKTCCRGSVSAVDSRSRLSMLLKYLAGSKMQDIMCAHGVSRSTVIASIALTMDAIIKEYPIPPFPFDDEIRLRELADGFRAKSTGGLFQNCVGAFDGFLLRIGKACIGKGSGIQDPIKFYCRKQFYAINCQVCCDVNRKVTNFSMLSPGAVPDTLAHIKSNIHTAIIRGKLPAPFYFVADNAYTGYDEILTPFTRRHLRSDVDGKMDNYNFYLSQIRINIECCFGMLVNKFPILLNCLPTTKLSTATKTFMVCCILHNLCIDHRLESDEQSSSPPTQRYTQRSAHRLRDLTQEDDFEFVDRVDEQVANDLISLMQRTDPAPVSCDGVEVLSRKDEMVYRIAKLGYVRPKRY